MVMVADIGGTKTVLASASGQSGEIILSSVTRFENASSESFPDIVRRYCDDTDFGPIDRLSVAVAGPVDAGHCVMTNLNWTIDAAELAREFDISRVRVLNDLAAAAYGLADADEDDIETIHEGRPSDRGNRVLVSPGTGLGEAIIHEVNGRYLPLASEGGHADFAPYDGTTMRLWEFLRRRRSRVAVEDILSGAGLFAVYSFLSAEAGTPIDEAVLLAVQPGLIITTRGLDHSDPVAEATLTLFLDVLAAECGNLALKAMALGGVYLGGGIVPRLLSMFDRERFARRLADKGLHQHILEGVPIRLVTDTDLPLYGAAEYDLAV